MIYFLVYVIENLMLPGQIENWNYIIDFGHMGVSDLPIQVFQKNFRFFFFTKILKKALKSVLGILQNNFIGRLYRMYLINVTKTISFFWNIIKSFLEETTTYKISLITGNVPENLYVYTNKDQTEKRIGGNCPDLTENFW